MSAIDRPKLRRLTADLDEKQAALRGLSNLGTEARSHLIELKQNLVSGADARYLDVVWNGRDLAELAALGDDELDRARVDRGVLRAAIAQSERMADLRRRHDALAAEVDPLARLVARLTEYAEAHA